MADLYRLYSMATKVTKSNQLFYALPTMYQCKFSKYPSTGSEDNTWKRSYTDAYVDPEADRKLIIPSIGQVFDLSSKVIK